MFSELNCIFYVFFTDRINIFFTVTLVLFCASLHFYPLPPSPHWVARANVIRRIVGKNQTENLTAVELNLLRGKKASADVTVSHWHRKTSMNFLNKLNSSVLFGISTRKPVHSSIPFKQVKFASKMESLAVATPPSKRNIEIKARIAGDVEFEKRVDIAKDLSKSNGELIPQHDVFFNVPNGRLKLRYQTVCISVASKRWVLACDSFDLIISERPINVDPIQSPRHRRSQVVRIQYTGNGRSENAAQNSRAECRRAGRSEEATLAIHVRSDTDTFGQRGGSGNIFGIRSLSSSRANDRWWQNNCRQTHQIVWYSVGGSNDRCLSRWTATEIMDDPLFMWFGEWFNHLFL